MASLGGDQKGEGRKKKKRSTRLSSNKKAINAPRRQGSEENEPRGKREILIGEKCTARAVIGFVGRRRRLAYDAFATFNCAPDNKTAHGRAQDAISAIKASRGAEKTKRKKKRSTHAKRANRAAAALDPTTKSGDATSEYRISRARLHADRYPSETERERERDREKESGKGKKRRGEEREGGRRRDAEFGSRWLISKSKTQCAGPRDADAIVLCVCVRVARAAMCVPGLIHCLVTSSLSLPTRGREPLLSRSPCRHVYNRPRIE